MVYDAVLADRVRTVVGPEDQVTEKRMFGGLAFLVNGHLAVTASSQGGLLLRVDPAETEALVRDPHADRFVMRGRELDGWLHIDPDGVATDRELRRWVALGVAYARSLPPKD
jgi:TfoX/Sxy family transcriptional regulator of competence genes